MAIYDDSRYMRTAPYQREDGTQLLSLRKRFTFNLDMATAYTWQQGDTLDGVAYSQYQIMDLRWAILDANPKYKTEFDIRPGDVIYIPDIDEVVEIVDG